MFLWWMSHWIRANVHMKNRVKNGKLCFCRRKRMLWSDLINALLPSTVSPFTDDCCTVHIVVNNSTALSSDIFHELIKMWAMNRVMLLIRTLITCWKVCLIDQSESCSFALPLHMMMSRSLRFDDWHDDARFNSTLYCTDWLTTNRTTWLLSL